jgi:hypothetical protein
MQVNALMAEIDATFTDYSSFETKFDNANYISRLKFATTIVNKTKSASIEVEKHEIQLVS